MRPQMCSHIFRGRKRLTALNTFVRPLNCPCANMFSQQRSTCKASTTVSTLKRFLCCLRSVTNIQHRQVLSSKGWRLNKSLCAGFTAELLWRTRHVSWWGDGPATMNATKNGFCFMRLQVHREVLLVAEKLPTLFAI